jgi:hypothetical protein
MPIKRDSHGRFAANGGRASRANRLTQTGRRLQKSGMDAIAKTKTKDGKFSLPKKAEIQLKQSVNIGKQRNATIRREGPRPQGNNHMPQGNPKRATPKLGAGSAKVGNRASGAIKAAAAAHKATDYKPARKPVAGASGRAGVLGKAGLKTAGKIPNGPGTVGYGNRGKTGLARAKMHSDSTKVLTEFLGVTPAQKRVAKRKTKRK